MSTPPHIAAPTIVGEGVCAGIEPGALGLGAIAFAAMCAAASDPRQSGERRSQPCQAIWAGVTKNVDILGRPDGSMHDAGDPADKQAVN
jgi:hypothetical protein